MTGFRRLHAETVLEPETGPASSGWLRSKGKLLVQVAELAGAYLILPDCDSVQGSIVGLNHKNDQPGSTVTGLNKSPRNALSWQPGSKCPAVV